MLHLDLVQSISLAGDAAGANDDRIGSLTQRAWVIDGATDLGPPGLLGAQGGAAWLAATADRAFATVPPGGLPDVISAVFAMLADAYQGARVREPDGRWDLPSAAFLCVALDGPRLDLAWLADCACLHIRGDTARRLGPQPNTAETREAAALRDATPDPILLRSAPTLDYLRQARARVDRRILGVEPDHAEAVWYDSVTVSPGDDLVLMTDGLAALIDDYGLPEADFVSRLRTQGLHGLATQLRAIEAGDADGMRFARFKRSDDATGLWLRVAGDA